MLIEEDEELPQKIFSIMKERRLYYEKNKRGVQGEIPKFEVHELVRCPRRSAFSRAGKEIPDYDKDASALTLLRGELIHNSLEVFHLHEVAVEEDEIVGHIDMMEEVPVEFFTTAMSSKDISVDNVQQIFSIKLRQLLSYIYMRKSGWGKLSVFFMMGDYSRPVRAQLKSWNIRPSLEDVMFNWEKLKVNREQIMLYLTQGRVKHDSDTIIVEPVFDPMYLDECEWCPFKAYCYSPVVLSKISDEELTIIGNRMKGNLFEIDKAST